MNQPYNSKNETWAHYVARRDITAVYVVDDVDKRVTYRDYTDAKKGYDTAPASKTGTRRLLWEQDGKVLQVLASMHVEA